VKHTFSYLYELDTTVGSAVAACLDAEHYVFLHRKYMPSYETRAARSGFGRNGTLPGSRSPNTAPRSTCRRRAF
jgi:hypothetical protein